MEQKLITYQHIPYNYDEEKNELLTVLKQARIINEIQSELACLIDIQDSDITEIHDTMEVTTDISHKATEQLEQASGKKFTFKPLVIGATTAVVISLPISIGAGAVGTLIGYIAGGSALLGGYIGKKLA